MEFISVKCPYCESDNVKKNCVTPKGVQRYYCLNAECKHQTFQLEYKYNAYKPEVRDSVFFQTVNGSGIRATARTLKISKDTVMSILKSVQENIWYVNLNYVDKHTDKVFDVEVVSVLESEMDEMWSFYGDKSHQIWLWWAIDHNTGEPLAFCFGTREHKYLDELRATLSSYFDIGIVYSDDNFAYKSHITESEVITGKRNTQRIERHHLSLRTWCSRLVRKGIRFSKSKKMHIIVLGIIINFWFFNHIVW
jgi:IS1 family transposase/transposase-like protein